MHKTYIKDFSNLSWVCNHDEHGVGHPEVDVLTFGSLSTQNKTLGHDMFNGIFGSAPFSFFPALLQLRIAQHS